MQDIFYQHTATEIAAMSCGTTTSEQLLAVVLQRLAYFPQEAAKQLSSYSMMLVIDARLPVAMFGYK